MDIDKKGVNKMFIDTRLTGFKLRIAEEKDIGLVLSFVKELAAYENLEDEVRATEESLKDAIFKRNIAEVIIGEYEKKPVCFALFYYSLSTFIGCPGIFIEDLYVKPEMRGMGMGTILLSYLAKSAKERNCWGLEWACLDWNEPSIRFYKSLGAVPRDEWTMYRLSGKELEVLVERFSL
jgi:GNAT superfamily N-acetyltransferase